MKIDFANLNHQYRLYQSEIDNRISSVLEKSNYIMGEEIVELEQSLSDFTSTKYCVSCSNGTDALILALLACDIRPGDEVITTPFTYISTAETIAFLGAVPVFVDVFEDTFNIDTSKIEKKINKKTKAIMPVSLFGQPPDLTTITQIAKSYDLKVIIDGAQSFGSKYEENFDSSLGDISTTSFFPAKPFGCYGDGGAAFTNNEEIAEKMKMLRIHGQEKKYVHKYIGIAGRLDTLQAAVLLAKLPHYKEEIVKRNIVAESYTNYFRDENKIICPKILEQCSSVWAQYTIRVQDRDLVQEQLSKNKIPTAIYYPIPLHLQECFDYMNHKKGDFISSEKLSNECLSLPMNPYLKDDQIEFIVSSVLSCVSA